MGRCYRFVSASSRRAGYSLAMHAMLQALYFSSVSKKATKTPTENKRGRQNSTKLSEPSFQAVWLYNTVPISDVRRFKRCLCNTSTKYKS